LRLGAKYGENRLEKACAIANESGATRYAQIELILKNKLDTVDVIQASTTPIISSHKNIRGSTYYK